MPPPDRLQGALTVGDVNCLAADLSEFARAAAPPELRDSLSRDGSSTRLLPKVFRAGFVPGGEQAVRFQVPYGRGSQVGWLRPLRPGAGVRERTGRLD